MVGCGIKGLVACALLPTAPAAQRSRRCVQLGMWQPLDAHENAHTTCAGSESDLNAWALFSKRIVTPPHSMQNSQSPQWVLVVDDDAISTRQLDVYRQLRPQNVQLVQCSYGNGDATLPRPLQEVCSAVDAFPALCDTQTNTCTYGLRKNFEHLESYNALQK